MNTAKIIESLESQQEQIAALMETAFELKDKNFELEQKNIELEMASSEATGTSKILMRRLSGQTKEMRDLRKALKELQRVTRS
jgi:gamma-glutamyl phosphate reductase